MAEETIAQKLKRIANNPHGYPSIVVSDAMREAAEVIHKLEIESQAYKAGVILDPSSRF